MSFASPGAKTQKLPSIPVAAGPADVTSRIAIRPVFVDDGGRRKRVLVRTGYVAAAACIGYLVVVGVSLTAGPVGPLAGLAEPLKSIADPVVVPPPVPQPKPEANVVTPAPATVRAVAPRRAPVSSAPAPAPAPVAVAPVSVAASTEPTMSATTSKRRGRTSVKPTVEQPPTASGPKPAEIQ